MSSCEAIDMRMSFPYRFIFSFSCKQTRFHMKGFVRVLVLIQRHMVEMAYRNKGRFPFDQKFRQEFPDFSMGEWYRLFQCGKRQAAQFCSLGIFQWLRGLNRKYRTKQNTNMSTSWLFIDQNRRDLLQTRTVAKKSQNKGCNESYNGSARVINLCTFPSQPTQNKQVR